MKISTKVLHEPPIYQPKPSQHVPQVFDHEQLYLDHMEHDALWKFTIGILEGGWIGFFAEFDFFCEWWYLLKNKFDWFED